MLKALVNERKQLALFCDFHGHSRKKNIFIFGCENPTGERVLDSHEWLCFRLLPYLLSSHLQVARVSNLRASCTVALLVPLLVRRERAIVCQVAGLSIARLQIRQLQVRASLLCGSCLFCVLLVHCCYCCYSCLFALVASVVFVSTAAAAVTVVVIVVVVTVVAPHIQLMYLALAFPRHLFLGVYVCSPGCLCCTASRFRSRK